MGKGWFPSVLEQTYDDLGLQCCEVHAAFSDVCAYRLVVCELVVWLSVGQCAYGFPEWLVESIGVVVYMVVVYLAEFHLI